MSKFTYRVTEADQRLKLRELLKRRFDFSARLLRKLKDRNAILCNGEILRLNETCKAGDVVTVEMPEETSYFQPEEIPISVVYEDEDLLVVNKQPGLVVHPTKGHKEHTLANGLMNHMAQRGEAYKIRFINRLDMDTSGLLLVGKNSHCQDSFAKQVKENKVLKQYMAVVRGIIDEEEGLIDLPIGKEGEDSPRRMVTPDGAPSITRYEVVGRFDGEGQPDLGYGKGFTLVRLTLLTGRTHQIRVHMNDLGHPLLGDHLYGPEAEPLPGNHTEFIDRQALHACRLSFFHPVTGTKLELEAELPEDMKELLAKLERRG